MLTLDMPTLEAELKKRLAEPATPWGRAQSDEWDKMTAFIYSTPTWSMLVRQLEGKPAEIRNYAINRWFNFWSAMGVEAIFCSLPGVVPARDIKDRLVDFRIRGISFDHLSADQAGKTTVYPKGFPLPVNIARLTPSTLIWWLYQHQSAQGRCHYANRLFVILCDTSPRAEHWKLRAELSLMKDAIEQYVRGFNPQKLVRLNNGQRAILSDIIWIVADQRDGQ